MDGRRSGSATVDPKWNGFSVGSMEGDALVVDSVAFDRRSWVDIRLPALGGDAPAGALNRRVDAETLSRDDDHRPVCLLEAVVQ